MGFGGLPRPRAGFRLIPIVCQFVLVGLIALTSSTLHAESPSKDEVRILYEQAKQALSEENFGVAIERFQDLLVRVKNDPPTTWQMLVGLALTYERIGEPASALPYYRRFLQSLLATTGPVEKKWIERRVVVEKALPALEAAALGTRAMVEIDSQPSGAAVTVDGAAVPGWEDDSRTPLVAFLAPGVHVVRFQHAGYEPVDNRVKVQAGVRQNLVLALTKLPDAGTLLVRTGAVDAMVFVDDEHAGAGTDVQIQRPAGSHRVKVLRPRYAAFETEVRMDANATREVVASWEGERTAGSIAGPDLGRPAVTAAASTSWSLAAWGWLTAGSGAGLVVLGGVFNALAVKDANEMAGLDPALGAETALDRWSSLNDSRTWKRGTAFALYGVGAAAIVGGVVMILLPEPKGATAAGRSRAWSFGVQPTVGGAAAAISGRW